MSETISTGNAKPIKIEFEGVGCGVDADGTLRGSPTAVQLVLQAERIFKNRLAEEQICKYFNQRLKTCAALISAVYNLAGGGGGLAHVAIDDENVDDKCLEWTIELCKKEQGELEAPIVKLLCELLLKQPLESRLFLVQQLQHWGIEGFHQCFYAGKCEDCIVEIEIQEWMEE